MFSKDNVENAERTTNGFAQGKTLRKAAGRYLQVWESAARKNERL